MPEELPVDRKYSLMIRDDLVQNLVEKHKQWCKNCFDETLTQEVEQLKKEVKDKWNARLHWPESTIQGVTNFWMLVREPYKAVVDARDAARSKGHLIIDKELKMTFLNVSGLIWCSPHKIPIIIDPTILTLHDAQTVKEEVWKIVEAEIRKRKNTIKGRDFAVPAKEPGALAAVLRCHPETFEKYLRWYDLKKAGLSFRLIALIQFRSKPEDREQKFREHRSRKKKVRNIGPEKGESTIREGFNKIHRAIKREPAPTQEDLIPTSDTSEKYNCPEHGESCSDYSDCAYRKQWMVDFDNKNKMPSLIEQISPF